MKKVSITLTPDQWTVAISALGNLTALMNHPDMVPTARIVGISADELEHHMTVVEAKKRGITAPVKLKLTERQMLTLHVAALHYEGWDIAAQSANRQILDGTDRSLKGASYPQQKKR